MKKPVDEAKFLLVGKIVKPHGIRGEVAVKSLTERPDLRFRPGSELYIGADESSLQKIVIVSVRPFKKGYLVAFENFKDRNKAEQIREWFIYIPRQDAAKPEEDTYYHHELIGLTLEDDSGNELGRVCAVVELEAYDLLEVERKEAGNYYVPLVDEFIHEVDPEAGRIRASLPDGLMDV